MPMTKPAAWFFQLSGLALLAWALVDFDSRPFWRIVIGLALVVVGGLAVRKRLKS